MTENERALLVCMAKVLRSVALGPDLIKSRLEEGVNPSFIVHESEYVRLIEAVENQESSP
jgi:hypothetical protein